MSIASCNDGQNNLRALKGSMSEAEWEVLAQKVGVSGGHLKNIAYGLKKPAAETAINLERETKRAIMCEDILPDIDWAYIRGSKPPRKAVDRKKKTRAK